MALQTQPISVAEPLSNKSSPLPHKSMAALTLVETPSTSKSRPMSKAAPMIAAQPTTAPAKTPASEGNLEKKILQLMSMLLQMESELSHLMSEISSMQTTVSDATAKGMKNVDAENLKKLDEQIHKEEEAKKRAGIFKAFSWALVGCSFALALLTCGLGAAVVGLAIGIAVQEGALSPDSPLGKALDTLGGHTALGDMFVKIAFIAVITVVSGGVASGIDEAAGTEAEEASGSMARFTTGAQTTAQLNPIADLMTAIMKPGPNDTKKKELIAMVSGIITAIITLIVGIAALKAPSGAAPAYAAKISSGTTLTVLRTLTLMANLGEAGAGAALNVTKLEQSKLLDQLAKIQKLLVVIQSAVNNNSTTQAQVTTWMSQLMTEFQQLNAGFSQLIAPYTNAAKVKG